MRALETHYIPSLLRSPPDRSAAAAGRLGGRPGSAKERGRLGIIGCFFHSQLHTKTYSELKEIDLTKSSPTDLANPIWRVRLKTP